MSLMAPLDKNAVIKEAQKFAAKGQFDKAIAEWKKVAKETPNDANVFNTIGDLCLKKNSKPEAVEAYQKAADILNADGFTSKAIALYKKVLNIDPKKIEAHLALADLNAEKGLTGNALESYKVVADHYTQHKETKKALGIYQKMADMNPSNAGFRLKLGDMYAKENMKAEAVKAYLDAADVHVSKDAFTEARQIFEKALALDPNNKDVYHKAGLVYYKEGKFVEACKALKPAFERDAANTELADLYLDALAKAGRGAEAVEVYQLQLEKEPERLDLREKLYRLCLSIQDFDRAFSEVSALVNVKIADKDLESAEALLHEFLGQAPRSVEGKRALSALYKTVGKTEKAAAALFEAAAILDEDGDQAGAREIVHKALELAPDHAQAQELRDRLEPRRPQAAPAAEKPAPAAPQAAAPEAPSEPDFKPTEWAPPGGARPAEEEDPAVAAAIGEIEVLVKYGLASKAVEQLEALSKKHPASIAIRLKLRDLYGDMGNMPKAVAHMVVLNDLYREQGRTDEADQLLQAAQGMDPGNAELQARLAAATPVDEQPLILDEILPASDQAAAEELLFQEPAAPAAEEDPSLDVSLEESLFGAENPLALEDFIEPPKAPEQPRHVEPARPQEAAPAKAAPQASSAREVPPPAMSAPVPPPPAEEIDLNEIWAEAEFYFQQGLFDEARKHYEKIIQFDAGNGRALAKIAEIDREQEHADEFSKLADAVDELEGLDGAFTPAPPRAAAGDAATSSSDEDAVRSLMQEIAELKQKPAATQQPARPSQDAYRKQPAAEEDFFDLGAELNQDSRSAAPAAMAASSSSDDFFDLASELRDELSSVPAPSASASNPEQQSLDDIFEDFKKGVEQQAIKEDADTHYNLGVAYKEMGLLDDAISEFVMTPEDEPKYVHSRYMLGLCYMEQGDYENSIIELKNALQCADEYGVSAEDHMSMCYDLGLAYQGTGDTGNALAEFQKVYGMDSAYRDVAHKIMSLQKGGISQQQLKSDIEREISSKFLAEGERIQREENARKNERSPRPW